MSAVIDTASVSLVRKGVDYPGVTVCYLCHDGEGSFVMNLRSVECRDEQGRWDTGGGGLDVGVGVIETLGKEIDEEYGVAVLGQEFLGYRDVHRELDDGTKTHWVALDFAVLVDRAAVRNNEPHKFDEIGWFTLESLPSPLHSQLPEFFRLHKEGLRVVLGN